MATNNVNNKVTFWNNVSFTPENVKNNFILNDIAGLDNKGIYFNSNKNYPHIIYNGYIYTTGSYISDYTYNNNVDPKGQVNVITNITADPFGKSISYQYTTIDIADILKRIDELEKQASITDISDKITLNPDTNNISLYVGSYQTISYSTSSGRLSDAVSDKSYIASVSKNDDNHTITITAANELDKDDDRTQTASIVLTSYSGIIGDKRYTSTEKPINVSVSKKPQNIGYGNSFGGSFTVGDDPQTLTIRNAYTDIYVALDPSNTDIISITYNSSLGTEGTVISENKIIVVTPNNKGIAYINVTPNTVGTSYIVAYATSSTAYKKSGDLKISVHVNEQPVENNYYWYVGETAPTLDNYTTLATQVTNYPSTYDYTVKKRGYVYVLISNSKSITRIYDTSNNFDQSYNEITSPIDDYKLYKTASATTETLLVMVIN